MAPNLKRTQLLLQTVDLDLLQPVKTAAFPPLTSDAAPAQSAAPQQAIKVPATADSSNYWEWSSENDQEIQQIAKEECLSTDRIVENILSQPATSSSSSTNNTVAANDHYWDWTHKDANADYWNWTATNDDQRTVVRETSVDSESYWAW